MASWRQIEAEAPDLTGRARELFDAFTHKTLATLRRDGSPRISGSEADFRDGELFLGAMWRSVKALDLRRDPRFALHSGSDEPDTFSADAKLSGRAHEVTDEERRAYAAAAGIPVEQAGFDLFRVDLEQVVLTALNEEKTALVISSWRPGRGVTRTERT